MTAIRYREECYGHSHGQTDCSIYAYDGDRKIGHLDIAYYKVEGRKEAYIKMVEVDPSYRGKGIGRGLIRQLTQNVPYDAIDWGSTTPDGTALKAVMDREYGTPYKPTEMDEGVTLRENLTTLKANYKDKLDQFWVHEKENYINLSAIVVKKDFRNQGIGSKVMKDLCDYADSVGKIITLTPASDYGGNVTRLKTFYKSFGFIENKGKKKDYRISDTMYRLPFGVATEECSNYRRGVVMRVKELKGLIRETVKKTLLEAGYDQYGEGSHPMESGDDSSMKNKMK